MVSVKEEKAIRGAMGVPFVSAVAVLATTTSEPVHQAADAKSFCRILGIDFFVGSKRDAVSRMKEGGLLVVPSAPALNDLTTNLGYREALLNADLCIPDSAYMTLIWNRLQPNKLHRLSGLEYLRELLNDPEVRQPGNTLWIMASSKSAKLNLTWLTGEGIEVPDQAVYIAPMYGKEIGDRALLDYVNALGPKHVIVTVGGGTQERVGLYLKRNLPNLPGIHCIGAAIAFLSGDQVKIPAWADYLFIGWLFRCISEPRAYVPRYWRARKLFTIMLRHRSKLPPIEV